MPAIRNRPRVDVVFRVPKALPWSATSTTTTSGMTESTAIDVGSSSSGLVGAEKGKDRDLTAGDIAIAGGTGSNAPTPGASATATDGSTLPVGNALLSKEDGKANPEEGVRSEASSSTQRQSLPSPPRTRPSETSCAEWNSLLIWARKMRGPQWDSSVGMWMVDQGGEEYYVFPSDPSQSVHSGGPSLSIPALAQTIQDHESSGLSSISSTRPPTATATPLHLQSQSQVQPFQQPGQSLQGQAIGHSSPRLAPPRTDLQHANNPTSAATSLDSKPNQLLPSHLTMSQGFPGGGTVPTQSIGRRASPRW